jgi:hypothetical protein
MDSWEFSGFVWGDGSKVFESQQGGKALDSQDIEPIPGLAKMATMFLIIVDYNLMT